MIKIVIINIIILSFVFFLKNHKFYPVILCMVGFILINLKNKEL